MSDAFVWDELLSFLAERLQVERRALGEGTYFTSDLGLDSIRALELVCDVEERFHCQIPDAAMASIATIGDLKSFVEQHKQSGGPS